MSAIGSQESRRAAASFMTSRANPAKVAISNMILADDSGSPGLSPRSGGGGVRCLRGVVLDQSLLHLRLGAAPLGPRGIRSLSSARIDAGGRRSVSDDGCALGLRVLPGAFLPDVWRSSG